MKFTAISDLHGYLPKDLPGGDVLCICGDIVPLDYQNDFAQSVAWFCLDFAPWADSQSYRNVVNVSLKDENYKVAFKPFTFSID